MNLITVTLLSIISFNCENKTNMDKCIKYFEDCYAKRIEKQEYHKYKMEYRKLLVLNTCGILGGYIKN